MEGAAARPAPAISPGSPACSGPANAAPRSHWRLGRLHQPRGIRRPARTDRSRLRSPPCGRTDRPRLRSPPCGRTDRPRLRSPPCGRTDRPRLRSPPCGRTRGMMPQVTAIPVLLAAVRARGAFGQKSSVRGSSGSDAARVHEQSMLGPSELAEVNARTVVHSKTKLLALRIGSNR